MSGYVSQKSRIYGFIEKGAIILGETTVGLNSVVGKNVIIGLPVEKSIQKIKFSVNLFDPGTYDSISKGSKIGETCIIRSGTVIYESADLGNNVRTGHNVLIREGSIVNDGTLIGSSTMLDGTVRIGKRVKIQSNVYLPNLTVVKDNVFIAPNVCFTNDPYPQSERLVGVTVEENAIVCANATILAGVKIGRNAVVGAGAVVTKDVPEETVVVGNPAKFLMTREEYEEKRKEWNKTKR